MNAKSITCIIVEFHHNVKLLCSNKVRQHNSELRRQVVHKIRILQEIIYFTGN